MTEKVFRLVFILFICPVIRSVIHLVRCSASPLEPEYTDYRD
jgi:hypothetical protein